LYYFETDPAPCMLLKIAALTGACLCRRGGKKAIPFVADIMVGGFPHAVIA
jgi:hypothetical protein